MSSKSQNRITLVLLTVIAVWCTSCGDRNPVKAGVMPTGTPENTPTATPTECVSSIHEFTSLDAAPGGLSWDGTNLLHSGGSGIGGSYFWKIDADGNTLESATGWEVWGLAWEGPHMLYTSWNAKLIVKDENLDWIGIDVDQSFVCPDNKWPFGITFDGTNLWVVANQNMASPPSTLYKLTTAGTVLAQYPLSEFCVGVTWDGTDIWVSAIKGTALWGVNDGAVLYRIDSGDGSIKETLCFPGTNVYMRDLAWDGGNLWAVVEPKIHKLSLP